MEKTSEEVFPKEYQVILENLLKDLKYGSINIIVQDGKIIQIDKTEKVRIKNRPERPEVFAEHGRTSGLFYLYKEQEYDKSVQ